MQFYETTDGRLGFGHIPSVLAELLRQIPLWRERESDEAAARLFPSPCFDSEQEEFREDWKAHVEPELQEIFQSARQVVEADLRAMAKDGDEFTLEFPRKHGEAWLNALNQARLAIAAQHELGEKELAELESTVIATSHDLAVLQVNFYAALQQWLIEALDE